LEGDWIMEFKYELKRMNVVKVTNDKDTKDKLIAQGFELIEKKKSGKPNEDKKVEEKPKK